MAQYRKTNELKHFGIKGQKWGVRRYRNNDGSLTPAGKRRYHSTSFRAMRAKRENERVDKGFKNWNENAAKKANAIDLGKQANLARMDYERNKGNKDLKKAYKQSNKEYKKALRSNTTYRKGQIRQEVGQDVSRKLLSEAKKVGKQLDKDPNNKALQKQYNKLMNQHDIERRDARRAAAVGAKRSARKAAIKRGITISVKTAAASAAVGVGMAAANKYMDSHNVTINGKNVRFDAEYVAKAADMIKKGKNFMQYFY